MTPSLHDFQSKLASSLTKGSLIVWLAFAVIFQILVYELHKSETKLASNQFDSAIHTYLSLMESRVALVANNPDFRSFIRSGSASRTELNGTVIESLASLRRDEIVGVSLRDLASDSEIIAIGKSSPSKLVVELCYLGDNLSPQFGFCSATLVLNVVKEELLGTVFRNLKSHRICDNCGKSIFEFSRPSDFVKLSKISNLTIDAAPATGSILRLEIYFFLLSLLVLGYGAWMRRSIGRAIQSAIIQPVNALIASLKSGENLQFSASNSFSEIISIQNHHAAVAAIANMTQMVAHDVRKPFSSVKSALTILNHAATMDEVREGMRVITPSIEKSLSTVNAMLNDIMEIGRTEKPVVESVSLLDIIEATLNELILVYQSADVSLRYAFHHKHALCVETSKVQRVISNIAGNALQAMKNHGEIWFETIDRQNGFVELKIGNTGPLIPQEDLSKLFDAFYSKGKKGGTGLGLAIAKKVVLAHGGEISCAYTADKKFVEFILTLPMGTTLEHREANSLPSHSLQLINSVSAVSPKLRTTASIIVRDPRESQFESHILEVSKTLGRPIVIAVLDDEPLYRTALSGLAGKLSDSSSSLRIDLYARSEELLSAFSGSARPDCLVCDIDLNESDPLDGFEVVSEIRKIGFAGPICIHSNRSSVDDSKKTIAAGGNLMLPKPMSRAHLLSFVASAFPKKIPTQTQDTLAQSHPIVVVLDDDPVALMGWELELQNDVELLLAESIDALLLQLTGNHELLGRICCVISDFWFEKTNAFELDVVGKLRAQNYSGPIFLASNASIEKSAETFNAVISKQALNWDELKKLISEAQSTKSQN